MSVVEGLSNVPLIPANAGLPRALPALEPHLQAESSSVRAAAVLALRLMNGTAEAEKRIAGALLLDPNKSVRRAAAEALSHHSPSDVLVTALPNALTSDPDVKVRRSLLETSSQWLSERPELFDTLEWVGDEDERPSLRRKAHSALTAKQL